MFGNESPMLTINNLAGARGDRLLFKNLSMTVDKGELLLIKGQNGAGKTSLLRLVCGLAVPEAGEICWEGESIVNIRPQYLRSLIYVGHDNGVNLDFTVCENLEFHRALKNNPSSDPISDILERLGIARYLDVPCRFLSAGQKRRVALARLLISNARLWLLDEPFNSLDDQVLTTVAQLVIEHLEQGGLCLATSHQIIDWRDSKVTEFQLGHGV